MKTIKFLLVLLAASFLFVACVKDEVVVTGLSLDKTELSLAIGESVTLTATVEPKGAADVTWESTNTAVASVVNGVVLGVSEGSAIIAATAGNKTASCMVTVVKESTNGGGENPNTGNLPASLQGSEYYVFQLDGVSAAKIQNKIKADYRPNETTNFLYIWESTYDAGATTGLNFYGEAEGWVSLAVTSVGWSGFGYNAQDIAELNKLSAVMASPADYYFHIAIKTTDNAAHLLGLDGTAGGAKVALGGNFVDNGTTYNSYKALTRDGEWNEIEIPMTFFTNQGLVYGSNNTEGKNVLWGLSGGVTGTTLQFDAAYIYKK